jgi:UPF0755 protein
LKKRILIVLGVFILLIGIVLGILWYLVHSYGGTPMEGEGKTVAVLIPKGAGPQTICKLLEEHQVISNQKSFYRYVRYYHRAAGKLKAGELAFKDNMTPDEVLDVLMHGTPIVHPITIPEGLRIDEMAQMYADKGLADKQEFEKKAWDPKFAESLGLPGNSLEGFLYPETYNFRKQTPVEKILKTMVEGYRGIFTAEFSKRAEQMGMSELEVITLASIVEKETGAAHERPLIAGVFHNRLRKNWRLDTDPTVIYAVLLARGSFSGNLTREDLRIDSPYNTYKHKGLPPGPICSPGKEAIRAVLWPEKTRYMFFVSKNDGTHHFCPTLSCHNRAVERYQGKGSP